MALPAGITPELIAMAMKLQRAGIGCTCRSLRMAPAP
ncbi:MAG: hypothetical protein RLZZ611_1593, partial [Cyanobacteriota bacterium]